MLFYRRLKKTQKRYASLFPAWKRNILAPVKWVPQAFWLESSLAWGFHGLCCSSFSSESKCPFLCHICPDPLPWGYVAHLPFSHALPVRMFCFLHSTVTVWNCLPMCLTALFDSKPHEGQGRVCLVEQTLPPAPTPRLARHKHANSHPLNEWTGRGKGTVILGTLVAHWDEGKGSVKGGSNPFP